MVEKEVTISEYISLLWRYKYLIILCLLIFTSLGFLFYQHEVPEYTAKSYLEISKRSIGTTSDIGTVQKVDSIITIVNGYAFMAQIAKNLELEKYPLQQGLSEKVKDWIKVNILKRKPTDNKDIREIIFYYMDNVRAKAQSRGTIIEITATSQYPNQAAQIANAVAQAIIEREGSEKDVVIQKSLGYINTELNSVSTLLKGQRRDKEEAEASFSYNELERLDSAIIDNQNLLSLYFRESEKLRTEIALDYNRTEDEKVQDDVREAYYETRVEELTKQINEDKAQFQKINRTTKYQVNDLKFAIGTNEKIYQNLIAQKQQILLADLVDSISIQMIRRAFTPPRPDSTKGILIIMVFATVGIAVSFGLIQLNEMLNKKFKTVEDIEESLNLNIMGNVPVISKKEEAKLINPRTHPKSNITEAYRTLATNIKFSAKGKNIKSIIFYSDKPSTGKSYTVANLAIIMGEAKNKVLIIDADLRRPNMHKIFNEARKPGLTDLLAGKSSLKDVTKKIDNHIHLIPSGSLSFNPQSVLESKAMKKFMEKIRHSYDFILIDSIPATTFSDVRILAAQSDASIIVMDEKQSERVTLEDTRDKLDQIGSNILGVVINRVKSRYETHNYGYYYQPDKTLKTSIFKKGISKVKRIFKRKKN